MNTLFRTALFGLLLGLFATAPLHAQTSILYMGDSITYGVGGDSNAGGYRPKLTTDLDASGYVVSPVGRQAVGGFAKNLCEGYSGNTITQLHQKVLPVLDSLAPRVAVILLGTNDIYQSATGLRAFTRLQTLVDALRREAPGLRLVLNTLPPSTDPRLPEAEIADFNASLTAWVAALQAAGEPVFLCDINGTLTTSDLGDGIHPTQDGYHKMAAAFLPVVQAAIASLDSGPRILTWHALPAAHQNEAFQQPLVSETATAPTRWTLASGRLPEGLFLNPDTGVLSGTPLEAGDFSFTVHLADAGNQSTQRAFSLSVTGPVLILDYGLDEGSGTAVSDRSTAGNNHSTPLPGAVWNTTGKVAASLGSAAANNKFATSGILPANADDLSFRPRADAFTLSTWVRIASGSAGKYSALFDKTSGSDSQVRVEIPGRWDRIKVVVGGAGTTITLPYTLADGQWHNVILTNGYASGFWQHRLYLDGTAVSAPLFSGDNPVNTGSFQIGSYSGGANVLFGNLDEVRVYRRALTDAEITQLHALGFNPGTNPPSAYTSWTTSFSLDLPSSSWDADPDSDGRRNLLEYALGLSPSTADSPPQDPVLFDIQDNTPVFTIGPIRQDPNLLYTVEFSTDLSTWESGPTTYSLNTINHGNGWITLEATDQQSLLSLDRRFARLKVQFAAP